MQEQGRPVQDNTNFSFLVSAESAATFSLIERSMFETRIGKRFNNYKTHSNQSWQLSKNR